MPENLNPEALDQRSLEAAAKALVAVQQPEVQGEYAWRVQDATGRTELLNEASAAVSAYFAALPSPRPGTLIKTAEELEALPGETVIKDAHGFVFEQDNLDPRLKARWTATGSKYPIMTECIELPATVLWVPTEGGKQ